MPHRTTRGYDHRRITGAAVAHNDARRDRTDDPPDEPASRTRLPLP
jgi:hypothetical protein